MNFTYNLATVKIRLLFFGALLLLATGCQSYALDQAQVDIRSSFAAGDFERTQAQLAKFKKKEIYKSKDEVLFNLESGMAAHFAEDYDSSIIFLSRAETSIDENYTKSISRGIGAFLVNDNKLIYDGEPYEDLYINAFKALNYIHLYDFDAALVEARRMVYKMEQLDIKIKGLVEAFAKSDTTGRIDWGDGKVNIQNSALSHYLSAILFSKSGNIDGARIELEKFKMALVEQGTASGFTKRDTQDFEYLQNPSNYNVLLSGFSGQAPIKEQEDVRIFWNAFNPDASSNVYLKFSFPTLRLYHSRVHSVHAIIDDSVRVPLSLIEEMDVVSSNVYKAKQSIIYGRALLRASFKAVSTKLLSNTVRKENAAIGDLLEIFGLITQEVSEKADLRGWQTLPGSAWMHAIRLSKGEHTVRIEYLSEYGRRLYSENYIVIINDQTQLELIESIYSN
ncbi:MAG: hypothetical protein WC967_11445 [Balneolaceae bacterium]